MLLILYLHLAGCALVTGLICSLVLWLEEFPRTASVPSFLGSSDNCCKISSTSLAWMYKINHFRKEVITYITSKSIYFHSTDSFISTVKTITLYFYIHPKLHLFFMEAIFGIFFSNRPKSCDIWSYFVARCKTYDTEPNHQYGTLVISLSKKF
jgi:hypothetical protein